jgi:2-polyprenyl-3-methyl-5-hydroxy-6-metoxy-1,4-benzoquinol methylase
VIDARRAYDAWHTTLDPDAGAETPWHRLVRMHLPALTGLTVLEVACGRGGLATWLAAQGAAVVVGADFSRTAVAKALALGQTSGAPALRLAVADVQTLALRDGQFDLVISCETIEHVADARGAVRELARVLRPGGTLLLTAPNYLGVMGIYRIYRELTGRPWTEEGQPINTVTTLPRTVGWVRQAGLVVVAVDGLGHDLPIPGRPPLPLTWLDRGRRPLRWLAAHSLVVARRPG